MTREEFQKLVEAYGRIKYNSALDSAGDYIDCDNQRSNEARDSVMAEYDRLSAERLEKQ